MKSRHTSNNNGFMALTTVLVISAVLLVLGVALNMSGLLGQLNTLAGEFKYQSEAVAQACVHTALLRIAGDLSYSPDHEILPVGEFNCAIVSVTPLGSDISVRASSSVHGVTTNLLVQVNSAFEIQTWQEVPTF